jgi:hypothetical protein
VRDEYQDVLQGKVDKDAIVLANQFSLGEKAGGLLIGHEWSSVSCPINNFKRGPRLLRIESAVAVQMNGLLEAF